MKCSYCKVVTVALSAALALSVAQVVSANELANPGFEDPVTMDGPPFVGSWEAFAGNFQGVGGFATSANGAVMPRTGSQHLDLNIFNDNAAFAGAFQDVPVVGGQIATFSGWHKLLSGNSGGSEVRIEWRDSVADIEVSRTPNSVPATTSDYTQFSLTAAVPANANIARVVYAIQSFGGAGNQNVLLDDMSFTAVPEPTSLALLGLAGVALAGMRRKSL